MLSAANLSYNQIPGELLPLVRKPRYFDLVLKYFPVIVKSGDLTVERLLYVDYKDRLERKSSQPLTEEGFREVIAALSRRYLAGITAFSKKDVKELIPEIDSRGEMLQEILDGGIMVPTGKMTSPYRVDGFRLIQTH